MSAKKIRKTLTLPEKPKEDIARFLPMHHPQMKALYKEHIISTGIDNRQPHSQWGEKSSQTHLYFFILEGELKVKQNNILVRAGQQLCVPSQFDKFFTAGDNITKFIWVHFSEKFNGMPSENSIKVIESVHNTLIYSLMESLLLESISITQHSNLSIPHLTRLFCHYVIEKPKLSSANHTEENNLNALWNRVSNTLDDHWSVPKLSKEMHMSESNFHRLVLKFQNKSPMQIIKEMRMERASSLLLTTQHSLQKLAQLVGYNNVYAFSDAFLKYSGMRPGRFRKRVE